MDLLDDLLLKAARTLRISKDSKYVDCCDRPLNITANRVYHAEQQIRSKEVVATALLTDFKVYLPKNPSPYDPEHPTHTPSTTSTPPSTPPHTPPPSFYNSSTYTHPPSSSCVVDLPRICCQINYTSC